MEEENRGKGGLLTLTVSAGDVDTVCEWIRTVLQKEPVEISLPHTADVLIEIYFEALLEAEIARKALPGYMGINTAEAREFADQDWTTFWQHHFHTMDIGTTLRIIPEWEDVPEDDRLNIIINPGLSFGTGGHFTTRFCLEALEQAVHALQPNSLIDAGTGSGILSIAAIKLGLPDVIAFDHDAVCIEQCLANAARNGVEDTIHFFQADVLESGWNSKPADVLCANILTSVLLDAARMLKEAAGKRLILSGIREIEADAIADTFIQLGCTEVSRDGDGQWCGIVLDV